MENLISRGEGLIIDLESGGVAIEEETIVSGDNIQLNNVVSRVVSRLLGPNGSTGIEGVVNLSSNVENSSEDASENLQLLIEKNLGELSEEHVALVDKKHAKEKRKKTNLMKASKPPRPPKGPSLDASDMKLVKEFSELAIKKRARIERMKALRKMKATKASSSSSNSSLAATIITILFIFVILFQGICSRTSSSGRFHGSPEPAVATGGLISVQFFKNSDRGGGPNSASPSAAERVSVSESRFPE